MQEKILLLNYTKVTILNQVTNDERKVVKTKNDISS